MYLDKDIVKEGAKSLKEVSTRVNLPLSSDDLNCAKQLYEYVVVSVIDELVKQYGIRPGVGIAAPQVGVNKRMFAIYYRDADDKLIKYGLVNPKIVQNSIRKVALKNGEGCLSVDNDHPGYVYRYHKIVLKAYDALVGKEVQITAKGYDAIVLQHELDHLEGLLLSDIGLEVDKDFDEASEDEQNEILDYYLESLDLKRKELNEEIKNDPELTQLKEGIDFITSVYKGETKIEKF